MRAKPTPMVGAGGDSTRPSPDRIPHPALSQEGPGGFHNAVERGDPRMTGTGSPPAQTRSKKLFCRSLRTNSGQKQPGGCGIRVRAATVRACGLRVRTGLVRGPEGSGRASQGAAPTGQASLASPSKATPPPGAPALGTRDTAPFLRAETAYATTAPVGTPEDPLRAAGPGAATDMLGSCRETAPRRAATLRGESRARPRRGGGPGSPEISRVVSPADPTKRKD